MSRKITQEIVNCFLSGIPKIIGNSIVKTENSDTTKMYLHRNLIAEYNHEGLFITNAGWFSRTTKERLNGLPNVSITQKKGLWYLNGKVWDGSLIKVY